MLVDDTNADPPHRATLDFVAASANRYQVLLDRRTTSDRHPTLWNGVLILQRV